VYSLRSASSSRFCICWNSTFRCLSLLRLYSHMERSAYGKLTVHRPLSSLSAVWETAEGKTQRHLWHECVPSAFEIRPTQGGLHRNPDQDDGGWASSPHPPFLTDSRQHFLNAGPLHGRQLPAGI